MRTSALILSALLTLTTLSKTPEAGISIKHKLISNIDYILGIDRNNLYGDLPDHCKDGDKDKKSCSHCEDGYYLVTAGKGGIQTCASCSDALEDCRICYSGTLTEKKDIICTNCVFPKMPAADGKECKGRTVLLYYFVVYCFIALVLGTLSCIEMKNMKKKKNFNSSQSDGLTKGLLSGSENLSHEYDTSYIHSGEDDDPNENY